MYTHFSSTHSWKLFLFQWEGLKMSAICDSVTMEFMIFFFFKHRLRCLFVIVVVVICFHFHYLVNPSVLFGLTLLLYLFTKTLGHNPTHISQYITVCFLFFNQVYSKYVYLIYFHQTPNPNTATFCSTSYRAMRAPRDSVGFRYWLFWENKNNSS